jgi:pimeloyl-ACP methyl ester carboxylesterase
VIVAHSQGATMSSYYLSRNPHRINAFVAVGMGATQKDSHLNSAKSLESINIPVLDLYGSRDLPGVLETVDQRKKSAVHNAAYSQKVTEGAEHFYDGYADELIETITLWLDAL